jgi:hypothetical protein
VKPQTQIKAFAYVVSSAYALVFLLLGIRLPSTANKVTAIIPTVLVLLFVTVDTFLWHLPPLKYLVRDRSRIGGTWKGELHPVDGDSESIQMFLVVRQTLTDVSLTLVTNESSSRSVSATLATKGPSEFTLYYNYQNIPVPAVRDTSPIHFGGVIIKITGLDPKRLSGDYWTDRLTRGSFEVTKLSNKRLDDFDFTSTKIEEDK